MSDRPAGNDNPEAVAPEEAASPTPPTPPKRSPGHRGQDVRDTVAELAARAHEISLEAGSKMASALKDVISAAAGISAFAIESARDLVQYMVRRGQMTQEEADKLIREAEDAHSKRGKAAPKPEAPRKAPTPPAKPVTPAPTRPAVSKAAAKKPALARKPAAKKVPAKPAGKKRK